MTMVKAPAATYRIQLHERFGFDDLLQIVPYLKELGVSAIYAAPVFASVPGSTHGYDCIRHDRINQQIGSMEQWKKVHKRLKEADISWLQDIVPNHMAFHPANPWLWDVLQKGRHSLYASHFDIDWDDPGGDGRLMVPFLGKSPEAAIADGELRLSLHNGQPVMQYMDNIYPVNADSYRWLTTREGQLSMAVEAANRQPETITAILAMQYYRLCHWQETDRQINYRRFFTINGLICLNIQDQVVFTRHHRLLKQLLDEGLIQGLRIDHIDGLYEPAAYLSRLREFLGSDCYTVVEKILKPDESLPSSWPCEGTTGYDFLGMVNKFFSNESAKLPLTEFYEDFIGNSTPVAGQVIEKKTLILHSHMLGELENLTDLFFRLGLTDENEITKGDLKEAIATFLTFCPVYRYYGERLPLSTEEAAAVKEILENASNINPELSRALSVLKRIFLKEPPKGVGGFNENAAHCYKRIMQYTGPLTAKGVEDTLMYTYNRFAGHSEVGDTPETFSLSAEQMHGKMIERQARWPLSLNTTSTHDTKRGEDVRARLQVLTDMPTEWIARVKDWRAANSCIKNSDAPDVNDEYLIYQTLVGTYPMTGVHNEGYLERLRGYLRKALREAKTHSDWNAPDLAYERATIEFMEQLLAPGGTFLKQFLAFQQKVVDPGIINSLGQLLLKFTCPGIPDTYQGTELWDLSLVDPDNRRPVDFQLRLQLLKGLGNSKRPDLAELWKERHSGKIKLWLTKLLMKERKRHPQSFSNGHYIPLTVEGVHKDHVFAFARRYQDHWYLVAVPLHIAKLSKQQSRNVTELDWGDTSILLKPEMPGKMYNLLSGETLAMGQSAVVGRLFKTLPILFGKLNHPASGRGAGVLLAISSLPGPFGVGDIGPQSKAFVEFLSRSLQRYWQILPLNPTEAGAGHSPYSSYSGMAGSPLLISPELLAHEGLLDAGVLAGVSISNNAEAAYDEAERFKQVLYDQAYANFKTGNHPRLSRELKLFCEQEAYWLDDMAIYAALKHHHSGKAWHDWEDPFKQRHPKALEDFRTEHRDGIDKTKWLQFIFHKQWSDLKRYANSQGVHLIGDIPFYVSYDSADVWANREMFSINEHGQMSGVAGVPPDYFSETGQHWGMPTFNWKRLKASEYEWWIRRLRKNLERYDLVRIDHFRAFQEYWEIPPGEETAISGAWLPGPGKHFFEKVRKALGHLPFVAEDLGDRMEAVYKLRGKLGLPGMKVLQFAWGQNIAESVDAPHNHEHNSVVYTGTHDNNTTVGWYGEETSASDHERMHQYLGLKVKHRNIHEVLGRVAYASVARIAMLPMQDILGLDARSRMNTPGQAQGNWLWRMREDQISADTETRLRTWARLYYRY